MEVFRAAGYDVDLVSVAGGEPPVDGRDENDSTQNDFLATAGVTDTPKAADVDPDGYDVILFAGGHGTMWDFPDDPDLARIARSVYERGGVVAAVCHGPSALVNLTSPTAPGSSPASGWPGSPTARRRPSASPTRCRSCSPTSSAKRARSTCRHLISPSTWWSTGGW
ncbi:DJ-1/PfpI family protein [Micromonospora sp. BRA006-A]|nr:DJ-1/PfpI family protein [Micromonospora sp. BRA006-A]